MFKKTLKINIVIIALVVAMGLPVLAEGTPPNSVTEAKTELQTKQPIGRKALAMKFIMAMVGVGVSSILIYVLLACYNKFVYGSTVRYEQAEEDIDFKTPTNMKDAINIFLKKTK
ncbi:hypothetical protein J6O48_11065 [bacterium]|nr:hypothetical protein [bacterium]